MTPAGQLRILIVYAPKGGTDRNIPLATISDPTVMAAAARAAVAESEHRADLLGRSDPALGAIENAEGERLRHIFDALIPGLNSIGRTPVM